MYRWLFLFAALVPLDSEAQQPLKGVTRSVDSFTGDTIWSTKYGRLDNPKGCGRVNLAITWHVVQAPGETRETVAYQHMVIRDELNTERYLGAVTMLVNVDGEIIEGREVPLTYRSSRGRFGEESATFSLPTGTLRKVANSKVGKLRIAGTENQCDGVIELNMQVRLRELLAYLDRQTP